MEANIGVLFSEVILSAYPLLIKLVDASVFLQTGLRMLVFTVFAILGAVFSGNPIGLNKFLTTETLGAGILNLIHVFSSYIGFERLPAGNAMALFYTYPLFNLIATSIIYGEAFPWDKLHWIILALLGAVAIAKPSSTTWNFIGLFAILIATFTEVGIYLWFKNSPKDTQPWSKMAHMYGSSGILWILSILFVGINSLSVTTNGLIAILLFNTFVGFVGYALRFYMIPKVSTLIFSSLSFFGIVSAYIFGLIGASETPSWIQLCGALAIITANGFLITKETV
jgi:drug/metabolite transporter (DMT)-like permease